MMAALAAVRVPSEGGYVRAGGKPVLSPTPLVAGVGGESQRLPTTNTRLPACLVLALKRMSQLDSRIVDRLARKMKTYKSGYICVIAPC